MKGFCLRLVDKVHSSGLESVLCRIGPDKFLRREFKMRTSGWWSPQRLKDWCSSRTCQHQCYEECLYLIFSNIHCKQAPGVAILFCCMISSKPCMEYNCLAPEWFDFPDWRGQEQVGAFLHHSSHSWLLYSQDSIPASSVCVQSVWAHRILEGTQGNILGWLFSDTIHHHTGCLSIKGSDSRF